MISFGKKKQKKVARYEKRYAAYRKAGFQVLMEDGRKTSKDATKGAYINRSFMFDARNYAFEWRVLNHLHGQQQGIEFKDMFNVTGVECTLPPLEKENNKLYRFMKNDRATSTLMKQYLNECQAELDKQVTDPNITARFTAA